MLELELCLALEFEDDALGRVPLLTRLPLVERVDIPNNALSENAVFVQRDEFPQRRRG